MQNTSNQRIRNLYLRLTAGTSTSVEAAWLVARIAVVFIGVSATYASSDGLGGNGTSVLIVSVGVIAYTVALGLLLQRGHVRAVFAIGFLLDNLVFVIAWWITAREIAPFGLDGEMWLILMPLIIVGVARIGPRLGLAYVAYAVVLLLVITVSFEPSDSYEISQLPVRMVFLGIVGALSTWLVSELNIERQSAEELLFEAETLAEIGQVVGSSLEPAGEFTQFCRLVRTLTPYDVLALAEIDRDGKTLRIVNLANPGDSPEMSGLLIDLSGNETLIEQFIQQEPRLMDRHECAQVAGIQDRRGVMPFEGTRSAITSALKSGDETVGTLIASSKQSRSLDLDHMRILARIAELVSASMTNLQVYSQTIQLANEREARHELDATNRRLQEDNEARAFFLSAVSHELRTPLTSIIAFNDLLLRNTSDNLGEREIKHLELIRRNSKQLALLVDDLLDLSYLGSNKIKLIPEHFRPSEALEQIALSVDPMFSVKGQRLKVESNSPDVDIIADRQRFSQIVANLLSNASKYSPDMSDISLTWSVSDGKFEMAVRDSGSGISEEEQAHLFQPFFRSVEHRAQKIPGTGLGLVIAKSLLGAHGGGISITSSQREGDGRGTEVRIWIPVDGSGISSYQAQKNVA